MRKQYPIYVETPHGSVRNKAINNVNCSSDICIFTEPQYYVSGATKIPYSVESCDLSGTNYSAIITSAFTNCFSAITFSTCYCGLTWNNEFYTNNELVYKGEILTTVSSSNTLTQGVYNNSVYTGLYGLSYPYSVSGGTSIISIGKPYGVNTLALDLCSDIIYASACTSGSCGLCVNVCTFNYPYMTSASTGVYFFGTNPSSMNFSFVFTGNMSSFDVVNSGDTTFKYDIFKYSANSNGFTLPAIYSSNEIQYSAISATSSVTITVSSSTLGLDGDYLIKGYFTHNACTDILRRLGVRSDTSTYSNGDMYSLYNEDNDYYFIGITSAVTPTLMGNFNGNSFGRMFGFSMFPTYDGQTAMTYTVNFISDPIVALNGLVLARTFDYNIISSAYTITFAGGLKTTDVITMIGSIGTNTAAIYNDLITISNPITSGATGGEGSNSVYYNTTTDKYEVYTSVNPSSGDNIVITLNGLVLAPNIDYYQSISNSRRFILEGLIIVGDVINLFYIPTTNTVGNIYSNEVRVTWGISIPPQVVNGEFIVEVSTGNTFTTLLTSASTAYQVGVSTYETSFNINGSYGSTIYYRVKNTKNYQNITGDIIASEVYSEIIPIIIASNAINSY